MHAADLRHAAAKPVRVLRPYETAMRELWYFIRYFAIYIHFVRGVLIALTGIVILCAILLMLAEGWGFGDSLYAAGITALTIGYGDITPKTIAGRVISVVIGLFGILYTGLMVAVASRALVSAVEDETKARARHRRQQHHRETPP